MTNLQVKYEDFVIYGFQNNQRKPSGLPTNQPTDISKTIIYPLFYKEGIKNVVTWFVQELQNKIQGVCFQGTFQEISTFFKEFFQAGISLLFPIIIRFLGNE